MTFTRTGVGHDILFAHGRIAVLQQLLLERSDVDRLLGAHDVAEFARILTELRLTSRIDQGIDDPENILAAVARWTRDEVTGMCPDHLSDVFGILWLAGDISLASFLLKKKLGRTSSASEHPSPTITAFPLAAWESLIGEDDPAGMPPSAVACVRSILAIPSSTPEEVDAAVARWGAEHQLLLAKRSGSTEILTFVRHDIDAKNIRTALRSSDKTSEERVRLLLPGGSIPHPALLGTHDDLLGAAERSGFGYRLREAIRESDPRSTEQALSAVSAADVAALWNIPLSIEPLFAFAALTISQLRLLRSLLIAKRAGFSPQETKQMLPPFLSAAHYALE